MRFAHTSPDDWQAAADLLADAALADSFDALREVVVTAWSRLFHTDFVTFDHWDNHGQLLSFRARPDPGGSLAALVEPFRVFLHEHPMLPHWPEIIEHGMLMHLSDLMPVRNFLRTGLWNEVFLHMGVKYQLAFGARRDRSSVWSLAGGRLRGDFRPRDRELCRFLRPRLVRIVGSMERHRVGRNTAALLGDFFARRAVPYLLVTRDARVLESSPSARLALGSALSGGWPDPERLPATCAELCSVLARSSVGGRPLPRFEWVSLTTLRVLVLRLAFDGTALVIVAPPTQPATPRSSIALTSRESEILSLLGEGQTNSAIAGRLGISPRTVDKHCENLFAKLGVETRLGAALLCASPDAAPRNLSLL